MKLASPLIHIPLYCAPDASDHDVWYLIELHLACLESYFVHQNTYDLLVTTNDARPLRVLWAYQEKSQRRFELRLVSQDDLLSTFRTDESRLLDRSCMRTIFSKFYPILRQECEAIVNARNNSERRAAQDSSGKRLVDYSYLCLPDTVDPRGPKGK